MQISLELYKTFYYVAKNKSITLAANELIISQPAVSKSIKTLEDQLDTKLFIRDRSGLILTDDGKNLMDKIQPAMELIEKGEHEILDNENKEIIINLGITNVFMENYLLPLITEYRKLNPNIKFRYYTNHPNELIKWAQIGLIDALFVNLPTSIPDGFNTIKLKQLHDGFYATNKYSEYKGKKLKDKDLEKLPLIIIPKGSPVRFFLDSYCSSKNIKLNPEIEVSSYKMIQLFTENGHGIGMLYDEFEIENVKKGKYFKLDIDCDFDDRYIGLSYPKENEYNKNVNKLLEFFNSKKENK